MEKTRLITIEYEEYLDLIRYKEMVQEAKANMTRYSDTPLIDPYGYTQQQTEATKLFEELARHDKVNSIKIVRGK